MMVPTWTETCWSGFYKFNWFLTTQRFCIIECIIWTIKHLILLLHGVTMTIIPNITVNQKLPYYWSQMPSQIPQKQTIYPVFLWIVYQHKFWLYIFYSIFLLLTNSMWNTHRFLCYNYQSFNLHVNILEYIFSKTGGCVIPL